jgi:protocatechuate 3,4-dioxygenase beta subunit
VLTDGIIISEDSPSLEIQVRPNAGILQGRVTDRENRPVQSALVALLPDPPLDRSKLQVLRKVVRTDQAGSFELRDVVPGDYHAYAWTDIQDDAYLDEDFVATFRDRGVPVHINTDHFGTEESMKLSVLNQQ